MDSLAVRVADRDLHIAAPQAVLSILERVLFRVPRIVLRRGDPLSVVVTCAPGGWYVAGSSLRSRKMLGIGSSPHQIAGAAISSALIEIGVANGLSVWRAAVVEHDDNALLLVGDDWESGITLAAHLHCRGWRLLGGDYVIADLATMTALPFQKMLHANSTIVGLFPIAYRSAVEASPWYSSEHAIEFFGIDPMLVSGSGAWALASRIRAMLRVDGRVAQHPSIEVDDGSDAGESTHLRDYVCARIEMARLVVSGFVETAGLVDSWFTSLGPVR